MRLAVTRRDDTITTQTTGEFFIPDLCGTRQVFVIVLLTELLVLVYTLAVSGLPDYDWTLLAEASLFAQWVVLLSAALLCLLRSGFPGMGLVAASVAGLSLVLVVTALSTLGAFYFYPRAPGEVFDSWALLRNLLIALVVTGIALRYFFLQHQLRLRERSMLQARLDALRARIRPHFLFNTLNSIASLIDSRPESAERAVEDLAELFRASLRESGEPATVADELRLCRRYLGIEQLRLDERLAVDWDVAPEAEGVAMPGLVLQPLVENAVYHGIARLPRGGTIRVSVAVDANTLRAEVRNPMPPERHSGGLHMALENIRQRLQALFGEAAGLEIDDREGEFRVRLFYPLTVPKEQP
ncbi:sensor histidine kinase [Parahaliea mediterranea]|uniref:Sensor histidine kinase n=1 Tax=Parahaliea mediterranea TaxID=651086 RepID=A0A939IN63_9GAMM|nr:sensor histidine kinase [Parahaliea mediterranea]MBN7798240.1 sensor histidine kinase [Parahaliea mediterranea]